MAVNRTYVQPQSTVNIPGGGNTMVQYNQNGKFAGDTGFKFDSKLKDLTVQGNINVGGWVKGKIYTNTYNFFLNGGANGQVLSTNGNGNLFWTDNTGSGNFGNGNVNVGNVIANYTVYTHNFSSTGTSYLTTMNVNAVATFSGVANVKIPGGSNGQILATDGAGNLTWITQTSGTSYSNANAVSYAETGWAGNIIPSANVTFDLGTDTMRWRDLYLSGNTIRLGKTIVSSDGNGGLIIPGQVTSGGSLIGFYSAQGDGIGAPSASISADLKSIIFTPGYNPGWTLNPIVVGRDTKNYLNPVGTNVTTIVDGTGTTIDKLTLSYGGTGFDTSQTDLGLWFIGPDASEVMTITGVEDTAYDSYYYLVLDYATGHAQHTATGTIGGDVWQIVYTLQNTTGDNYIVNPATTTVTCNGSPVVDPVKLARLYDNYTLFVHQSNLSQLNLTPRTGPGDYTVKFNMVTDKAWFSSGYSNIYSIAPVFGSWSSGTQGTTAIVGDSSVTGNSTVSGNSTVTGNSSVSGDQTVSGNLSVSGNVSITGNLTVSPTSIHMGNTTLSAPSDEFTIDNGYVWTFDNTGNIVLPTSSSSINYANGDPYGVAALPIANGTSNLDIATADGDVTITSNTRTWTFSTSGALDVPKYGVYEEYGRVRGNGLQLRGDTNGGGSYSYIILPNNDDSVGNGITVANDVGNVLLWANGHTWTFNSDGNLTMPGNLILSGGVITGDGASPAPSITGFDSVSAVHLLGEGGNISNIQVGNIDGLGNIATLNLDGNVSNILRGDGTWAPDATSTYGNSQVAALLSSFGSNTITTTGDISVGNVQISGNLNNFVFASSNLTLPGNTFSVYYNNGTQVTLGWTGQQDENVYIGLQSNIAGNQGTRAVAVGALTGVSNQGNSATAVGDSSGFSDQGDNATAVGMNAGSQSQAGGAVAVGASAGYQNQGANSIAIGAGAGYQNQANNSIVLNATGGTLDTSTANSFVVKPIRNANTANTLFYDPTSGEITYDVAAISSNTGNFTFSNNDINTANNQSNITLNITGAGGKTWIFANTGDFYSAGNMQGGNITGTGNLSFNNWLSTPGGTNMIINPGTSQIRAIANLEPYHNDSWILGNSSARWKTVYANGGNFSGSINATTITLTGTGTAVNAGSGNILTNQVTGTKFNFLNGIYTASITGQGATSNYALNLPSDVGSNGQVLTSDGTGNLSWTTPSTSSSFIANGNSNVTIASLAGNVVTNVNGALALTVSTTGIKVSGGGVIQSPGGASSITLNNNGFSAPLANLTQGLNVTGNANVTANVSANYFVGNGAFLTGITANVAGNIVGTSPNVQLVAGSYTTTFDNTGNVTFANSNIYVGVTNTILPNTVASFSSNINNYTQVTNQNKSTGADATADYVLTADNGSDTVNFGDFGIINSGYDNNTPTNSLGNIVYAGDTYLYAQGNVSNVNQSGGNLAFGTTVPGKVLRLFAGGTTSSNIAATISNTGIAITGNLIATGNVSGTNLLATNASGNEGGEIQLTKPPNGTLSGGVSIDAYSNQLRFFEQGGTARGMYVDIANSPASVGAAIGYRDIPQVAASNTTLAASDAGKHYYSTSTGNFTLTIPNNTTTSFSTGTAISIVMQGTGNILVNASAGVTLYMAGNSTAANRVVGTYGMATLMKVATDTWFINGTGVS